MNPKTDTHPSSSKSYQPNRCKCLHPETVQDGLQRAKSTQNQNTSRVWTACAGAAEIGLWTLGLGTWDLGGFPASLKNSWNRTGPAIQHRATQSGQPVQTSAHSLFVPRVRHFRKASGSRSWPWTEDRGPRLACLAVHSSLPATCFLSPQAMSLRAGILRIPVLPQVRGCGIMHFEAAATLGL